MAPPHVSAHVPKLKVFVMRDAARDINPSQHEAALRHLAVYKQWLLEEVLQVEVQNAVVMLPLGNVKPNYRDDWPGQVNPLTSLGLIGGFLQLIYLLQQ